MLAPICLFTYNRLEETKQTILALKNNKLAISSELIIFSDGWKDKNSKEKILELRSYLKTVDGFKNIVVKESAINNGLANSIISGVTEIFNKYDKIIVMEDDLLTTPNFLCFMNQSLDFYKNNDKIQSISGYSLKIKNKVSNSDVYFHPRPHSWSWATWSDRWNLEIFDKEKLNKELTKSVLNSFSDKCGEDISEMLLNSIKGVNDSWYVRWVYNHFKNGKYGVYPYYSKVENIGFSNEGTHCHGINVYKSEMDLEHKDNFKFINTIKNPVIIKEFLIYFSKIYKLKFRIKLLFTSLGRKQLKEEISRKYIKKR